MARSDLVCLLVRGTSEQHSVQPFKIRVGNFSLVTDKPELRFHDGTTVGGIVIPLDPAVHARILEVHARILEVYSKVSEF